MQGPISHVGGISFLPYQDGGRALKCFKQGRRGIRCASWKRDADPVENDLGGDGGTWGEVTEEAAVQGTGGGEGNSSGSVTCFRSATD